MRYRDVAAVIAGVLVVASSAAAQTDYLWMTDGDGSWTDSGNWAPPGFPDGPGDWALFDLPLTSPVTVDVNAPITVGRIVLADWNWDLPRFTLAPGPGGGSLTFDGGGAEASIVGFGRHEIAAPVILNDTLWVENTDEGELELLLSGSVAGGPGQDLILDGMRMNVDLMAPANPVQGAVIVYPTDPYSERAALTLTQQGTVLGASHFEAHLGAIIGLDNAVTNVNNRMDSPLRLYGGGLGLHGNAAATTETLPHVDLVMGSSSLGVNTFVGGDSATLHVETLDRAPGATIEFWGWELMTTAFILIGEPAGPTLDWGGLVGGWAVVSDCSDRDFATYAQGQGVMPVPVYANDINAANPRDNVLLDAPDMLLSPKTINSVKIAGGQALDLGQNLLNIASGGVLCTPDSGLPAGGPVVEGQAASSGAIRNGQLTAGGSLPEQPELIVHVWQDLEIAAAIVDNGLVPVSLTVSGSSLPWWEFARSFDPVLTLSGLNAYTGPTTICSARVAVDADERLGDPAGPLVLAGGMVQATSTFTMNRDVEVYDGAAFEVARDQTLTLAGEVGGEASELHVRAIDGEDPVSEQGIDPAAPRATLVLAAPNTFKSNIVVGAGGDDGPVPVLEVSEDANLGDPDQDIMLRGGIFRAAGSFAAHAERVFVIDWAGGAFDVDEGEVFSLDAPWQLEGDGSGMKIGLGKMVVSGFNPRYNGPDMEVAEGVLELRDPAALNGQHITVAGGVLNLRHDADVEFPDNVTVRDEGGINVDGSAAADPVLSIAGLELEDDAELTVTGGPGYSLAVEGDTTLLGWFGVIRTQTADLTLNGTLRMSESTAMLMKEGPATLNVSGPQAPAALTNFWATGGTTNIDTDGGGQGAPPARNLTVEVHGSGTVVNFRHSQHLAGLSLAGGGMANLTSGGTKTIVVNALAIDPDTHGAPAGTLDLTDNNLICDYTDGTSPFDAIAGWIASGFWDGTNGYWDGPGITSSAAAAQSQRLAALGVIDNNDPQLGIGDLTDLEGEPVPEDSVLVKYTWWGDANLDGIINSNDYDKIDTAWLLWENEGREPEGGFRWAVGDFNYDGTINSNDYDKIDNAWILSGGAPLGGGRPAPTPEPATLALLAVGALAIASKRR